MRLLALPNVNKNTHHIKGGSGSYIKLLANETAGVGLTFPDKLYLKPQNWNTMISDLNIAFSEEICNFSYEYVWYLVQALFEY